MCSISDFIAKQNYFMKTKRKTIESLYQFLDSVDRQAVPTSDTQVDNNQFQQKPNETNEGQVNKKSTVPQETGDSNDLMLEEVEDLFGGLSSAKYDLKRRQLADQRRQEYQLFLEQKSKLETELQNEKKKPKRVVKVDQNYKELLNKKRNEERKHNELNGVEGMDIDDFVPVEDSHTNGYTVPIVGQFYCSNNKFSPDFITPRSRLLATHSSRLKAQKYREELRKQCEERQRIKDEERERIRLEEEELERKLEVQRMKLLLEYEAEQRAIRQRAERSAHKKDVDKHKRDSMTIPASPLSLLRSPTYMHMRDRQPSATPMHNKSKTVSRSLASAMSQSIKSAQPTATQTNAHHRTDPNSAEYYNSDADSSSSDDEINDDQTKEVEFRKRVLSQLSEVRQMMENDHILMMEGLRQQQQTDE